MMKMPSSNVLAFLPPDQRKKGMDECRRYVRKRFPSTVEIQSSRARESWDKGDLAFVVYIGPGVAPEGLAKVAEGILLTEMISRVSDVGWELQSSSLALTYHERDEQDVQSMMFTFVRPAGASEASQQPG